MCNTWLRSSKLHGLTEISKPGEATWNRIFGWGFTCGSLRLWPKPRWKLLFMFRKLIKKSLIFCLIWCHLRSEKVKCASVSTVATFWSNFQTNWIFFPHKTLTHVFSASWDFYYVVWSVLLHSHLDVCDRNISVPSQAAGMTLRREGTKIDLHENSQLSGLETR